MNVKPIYSKPVMRDGCLECHACSDGVVSLTRMEVSGARVSRRALTIGPIRDFRAVKRRRAGKRGCMIDL